MQRVVRNGAVLLCMTLYCAGLAQAAVPATAQPNNTHQSPQRDAVKGAGSKPKATQKRRHAGTHSTDVEITRKVRLALTRAQDLDSADIDVETQGGIVRLSGEVENPRQVARVKQLAARVKGVRKIESRLTARTE